MVVAVAVALSVIVLVVRWIDGPNRDATHALASATSDSSGALETPNGLSAPRSALSPAMERESVAGDPVPPNLKSASSIAIEVVDESGRSIERAELALSRTPMRLHDASGIRVVGQTGSDGRATISLDTKDRWVKIVASASGYLTSVVPIPALDDGFERITMTRACDQLFRCIDLDRVPLAGVGVTTWMVNATSEAVDASPLGDRFRGARYVAETDRNGIAELRSLLAGDYDFRVRLENHAIAAGSTRRVTVPGDPIEVVLCPLVGGVVVGRDGHRIADAVYTVSGPYDLSTYRTDDVTAARARLETQYAGSSAFVAALASSEPPPPIQCEIFMEGSGVMTVNMKMYRLADGVVPTVVAPTSEPDEIGRVTITIVDANGRTIEPEGFRIDLGTDPNIPLSVDIDLGAPMLLPVGEHPVSTTALWMQDRFEPASVRVPGECVIRLSDLFRHCRIVVSDEGGTLLGGYQVWTNVEGHLRTMHVGEPQQAEAWLPLGPTSLWFNSGDFETFAFDVEIVDALDVAPQRIEVTVPSSG